MYLSERVRLGVALLWTLGILIATTMPTGGVPNVEVSHMDKLVHFAMFFGFGTLWMWALPHPLKRRLGIVVIVGVMGAVGTEGLQLIVPFDRNPDIGDVVANMLGLGAGIGLFLAMVQARRSESHPSVHTR